jgi:hypothetical protein
MSETIDHNPNVSDDKERRLRAFFLPEEVECVTFGGNPFRNDPHPVQYQYAPSASAIRDRLDLVLGSANWSEELTVNGEWTEAVLRVRFSPGPDWVQRFGRASGSGKAEEEEAFREAARKFGIGRYLVAFWEAGKSDVPPRGLPQEALPGIAKECGREDAQKLRRLLEQCCTESKTRGKPVDPKEAARKLASRFGYPIDSKGEVNFAKVENRHASAMLQALNDWLSELAKTMPTHGGKEKKENSPPTQAAEPQQKQGDAPQPAGAK